MQVSMVTLMLRAWAEGTSKSLKIRIVAIGRGPTNLSVCSLSCSAVLKAFSKAGTWALTLSPHQCHAGLSFCKDICLLLSKQPLAGWEQPQDHIPRKFHLWHHVITEPTLAHTKLSQICIFKGFNCSQKYCSWWQAIKLCNNLQGKFQKISNLSLLHQGHEIEKTFETNYWFLSWKNDQHPTTHIHTHQRSKVFNITCFCFSVVVHTIDSFLLHGREKKQSHMAHQQQLFQFARNSNIFSVGLWQFKEK